jgi:D-threo-aldose 1-dehydrogenase
MFVSFRATKFYNNMKTDVLKEKHRLGLGGVAIGTAFDKLTDGESYEVFRKHGISAYDITILHRGTD